MYIIGNLIYGFPLTEDTWKIIEEWEEYEDDRYSTDNEETCGFTQLYHGGSDLPPGYCGVLIREFDECEDIYLGKDSFNIKVTELQKKEALSKIEKLNQELKAASPNIGLYIVWSSS